MIQICFSCSTLYTDALLLHLVGKRQLLVYLGASYGNGKLGDSIWESHHKSSAQGKHSPSDRKSPPPPPPPPSLCASTALCNNHALVRWRLSDTPPPPFLQNWVFMAVERVPMQEKSSGV